MLKHPTFQYLRLRLLNRWIFDHCKNRDEVRKVRGNLALSSALASSDRSCSSSTSLYETERKMLLADRSRLIGELHSVFMKVERLKEKLEYTRTEHLKSEGVHKTTKQEIDTRQKVVALLSLYIKKTNLLLNQLQSSTGKFDEVIKKHRPTTAEKSIISHDTGVVPEENVKIDEVIQHCSEFFKGFLGGKARQTKSSLREEVVGILGHISADLLLKGVVQHTANLCKNVAAKSKECHSDATSDDLDSTVEVFSESVSSEISNLYRRHLKSHNETIKVENRVSILEEKVDLPLKNRNGSSAAALRILKKSLQDLTDQSMVKSSQYRGNNIEAQQDQIECLCQVISSLIMKSSAHGLKAHQLKTLEVMNSTVPYLTGELSKITPSLRDFPSSSLRILNSTPTWKLGSTKIHEDGSVTMTPTSQLSVLRATCSRMPLPPSVFSHEEDLVTGVSELLENTANLEKIISCKVGDISKSPFFNKIEKLESVLSINIKEQGRNLMPAIEECKLRQKKTLDWLGVFETRHNEWKTQPASQVALQESGHWGLLEGRSLQETVELARNHLNKLYI